MNRLPIVISMLMLAVTTLVTGCRRAPHYYSRLVVADSLMLSLPDSALVLVEAVTPDSLATVADQAYRDLLLTQARYKCYQDITAGDDSAINRALAYYRSHSGEREKLTRAYLYKGGVMEELGRPDSAMFYFKTAEANADEKDYANLAYSNYRIAEMYRKEYSQDSAAILRYKEAIKYYRIVADSIFIVSALGNLGTLYGTSHPDSSKYYLYQAIRLAQKFNPSLQYPHLSSLAGIYYYEHDFEKAKRIALDILTNGKDQCEETQYYYYAALSYLELGKPDSAKYIFGITPQPVDAVDSMSYYNVLAEIANSENRHDIYKKYKELSHDITEKILSESQKGKIAVAEKEYDKTRSQKDLVVQKEKNSRNLTLSILLLLTVILFIIYLAHRHLIKQANENKAIKRELEQALADLKEQAGRNKSVSELVAYRTDAIRELYQDIRIRIKDESKVKKVIPLTSIFKTMHERNEILRLNLKDSFWENMKRSVDGEYNGIYTFVEQHFTNLTDRDLKLFCLIAANLSPQIIKLCMNIDNAKSITNYRSVIIKKKMGLDMSFDSFVKNYMKGEFENGFQGENRSPK